MASRRRTSAAPACRAPRPVMTMRALGRPERVDRFGDGVGIGRQKARRLCLHPFVEHQLWRHRCAQNIGRNFDIGRAWLAGVSHRPRDRFVELAHHLLRHARGARGAGDRPQDVDVRDVLQRSHVRLRPRRAAADQQHRRAGERGIGHRGYRVGYARAGRDHGDAQLPRQLGMRVRHVHRGTLVPDIDDVDALPCDTVPDRLNVTALQAEDPIDATRFEKAGDPGRAGLVVGVEIVSLCRPTPSCASPVRRRRSRLRSAAT